MDETLSVKTEISNPIPNTLQWFIKKIFQSWQKKLETKVILWTTSKEFYHNFSH